MHTLYYFALLQLRLGHPTDAGGSEVGVTCLNTSAQQQTTHILYFFNLKLITLVALSFVQCWFELSGQNENLNFKTRFSQIGLRLDKKWRKQKLLRISSELIWCIFFSATLNQNFTPKMGHFGFFRLIKNYAEITLLIDEQYTSQEALHSSTKF